MPNESQGHREYIGKWWYPWDGLTINPHTPYIVGICWVYPFLKGSTIFPMTGCNLGLGFTMLNYSEACNFSYLLVDACSQPMRRPETKNHPILVDILTGTVAYFYHQKINQRTFM